MKTGLMTILLAGTALALSGCATEGTTVVETRSGGPCVQSPQPNLYPSSCSPGVTVRVRRELQPHDDLPMGTGAVVASAINFAAVKISTAGSTVGVPSTGTFIITLKGQNGLVIAQNVFPWVKSGTDLVASNAQSVTNWMSAITQTVYYIDIDATPFQIDTVAGPNVFTATFEYNNTPMAISSSAWTSSCPSGPQSDPLLCG